MNFEDLSAELKERARACKTIDELISFAEEEGFKLTNEELEGISGGICKSNCPWHGVSCRNDINCRTKRSLADKVPCITFGHCAELAIYPVEPDPNPTPTPPYYKE